MKTPYNKTNKTFICIDDQNYSFGSCQKFNYEIFDKQHCYMSFLGDCRILCGNDAYESTSSIRFPIFTNPERIKQDLEKIKSHYIQRLDLEFCGIKLNKVAKIPIGYCYFMMINYIVESFVENVNKNGYSLDEVTVFLSDTMNEYVLRNIKDILLIAAGIKRFKIEFVSLAKAIADRISLRDCSGIYVHEHNCQFLTIDIGTENTRLELFKGMHSKEENYIRIFFDRTCENYVDIEKNKYDEILKSFDNFKNFEKKSFDDQLKIDNDFRKLLGIEAMNSIIYCNFKIYSSFEEGLYEITDEISLGQSEFENIPSDLHKKLEKFNILDTEEQIEILKNIGIEKIGNQSLSIFNKDTQYIHCNESKSFSLQLLPLEIPKEINFYEIKSVASEIINLGRYDFEEEYLKVLGEISKSKFTDGFVANNRYNSRVMAINNLRYLGYITNNKKFIDLEGKMHIIDLSDVFKKIICYFDELIDKIEKFVDRYFERNYDEFNSLDYIIIGKSNPLFDRRFMDRGFTNLRYPKIWMSHLDLDDIELFNYSAGSYYLYNHQHDFTGCYISKKLFDGFSVYYNYFGSLRRWLDENYHKRVLVGVGIDKEMKALEKSYNLHRTPFDGAKFCSAVILLKDMYCIAESLEKAYLQWRRQFCSDEQIAKLIPEMESGLF